MGQIKVEKNVGGIEGLCVIEPAVHGDARGYFMETYNEKDMKEAGIDIHFVQDKKLLPTPSALNSLTLLPIPPAIPRTMNLSRSRPMMAKVSRSI